MPVIAPWVTLFTPRTHSFFGHTFNKQHFLSLFVSSHFTDKFPSWSTFAISTSPIFFLSSLDNANGLSLTCSSSILNLSTILPASSHWNPYHHPHVLPGLPSRSSQKPAYANRWFKIQKVISCTVLLKKLAMCLKKWVKLKILLIAFIAVHANALGKVHILFQIKKWRNIDQKCFYFTESEEKGILGCSKK